MKKIMPALAATVGLLACGGEPRRPSACADMLERVNGLACIGSAKLPDTYCGYYTATARSCDYTNYFKCMEDYYSCDGDTLKTGATPCKAGCN